MDIFDLHADIFSDVATKKKLGEKDIFKKYHLKRFNEGNIIGGIFVAWLDNKISKEEEKKEMNFMVEGALEELRNNLDIFKIIKSTKDLEIIDNKKINIIMGIEGLRAIGEDLESIDKYYDTGFRHVTLTWNEENSLGAGAWIENTKGLTDIGKKAIEKLNHNGMIVDVSHLNEKTFWDIINITKNPIIVSHSNVKKICDVARNLTDEQMLAIKEKGGLIGVNAYVGFIKKESRVTIDDFVDHIDYIVKLLGIDYVAFGFDFCEYLDLHEDTNPIGLEDASKAQNMILKLKERNYSDEDIEKIAYKNFLRVLKNILPRE